MAIKTASGSGLTNSLSSGLVLLNTTSFSGVTSVSLPTGTFNATYKNYRVIFRSTQSTNLSNYLTRLRANGVDDSTANYSIFGSYSGYSAGPTRINSISQTSWFATSAAAGNIISIIYDLTSPFVSNQTIGFGKQFSTSAGDDLNLSLQHGLSNSYDSLSFLVTTGSMAGQVSAYGYNE